MKKGLITLSLFAAIAVSFKQKPQSSTAILDSLNSKRSSSTSEIADAPTTASAKQLDPNSIPITNKLTGAFPYFQLPSGYHYRPKKI